VHDSEAVRWLPMDGIDDEGNRFGWDHCRGPLAWQELEQHLGWPSGRMGPTVPVGLSGARHRSLRCSV